MKNLLSNKRGEAHLSTGVKIIIAVVIGSLILGGLYLLFAGDTGLMKKVDDEVGGMMDYMQELRVERALDEDSGQYYLRYSYDGRHWQEPNMPDYGDSATVYGVLSNNSESNPIEISLIQVGTQYHILASTDGGITWIEKANFTGTGITHFYYGTSDQLPVESGSFSGERFVIRYCSGGSTYFTLSSSGLSWSTGGWSDLIRP